MLLVKYHSELLAKQYWLSCYQSHHPCHHLTTLPASARNMKGTLMKSNSEVVPLPDEVITDVDIYRECLRTLHTKAVVEAKTNFVPNRVLGYHHPSHHPISHLLKVSPLESLLISETVTAKVSPYHSCPVAFWSLSALEHIQGLHRQRHDRCLPGV